MKSMSLALPLILSCFVALASVGGCTPNDSPKGMMQDSGMQGEMSKSDAVMMGDSDMQSNSMKKAPAMSDDTMMKESMK